MNKINKLNSKEFVLISNACVGDNILVSTLAQNIKKVYENSKVILITCSKNNVDFMKYLEGLDKVYFWDRKGKYAHYKGLFEFIKKFPYKNIYAVFPLYNFDRLVIFAHLLRPKYVVTTSQRIISTLLMKNKYFLRYKKQNIQLANLNLLKGITKEKLHNYPIKYNLPNIATKLIDSLNIKNYVVLCPISSNVAKDMPFIEVKNAIESFEDELVLLASGKRAEELSKYLQNNVSKKFVDLMNKTTLEEAAHFIKNAKSVISVDTGLLHLACALNKKTIEIIYDKNYQEEYLPDKNIYDVEIIFDFMHKNTAIAQLSANSKKAVAYV